MKTILLSASHFLHPFSVAIVYLGLFSSYTRDTPPTRGARLPLNSVDAKPARVLAEYFSRVLQRCTAPFAFFYLASSRRVSSYLISSRLISSCLVSSRLVSSRLVSSHLVSSRLVSLRLALSCLASPRLVAFRFFSRPVVSSRESVCLSVCLCPSFCLSLSLTFFFFCQHINAKVAFDAMRVIVPFAFVAWNREEACYDDARSSK